LEVVPPQVNLRHPRIRDLDPRRISPVINVGMDSQPFPCSGFGKQADDHFLRSRAACPRTSRLARLTPHSRLPPAHCCVQEENMVLWGGTRTRNFLAPRSV